MRLRTPESYWLIKNGLLSSYPSLQANEDTQLVVIGGGITGALVSYSLIQNNYKVILIDKRDIGMGSTSATTSMLQYETDIPLYKLAEQIGETGAVECYKKGIKAIGDLEQLISLHNIDCDFEKKQSLYIARTEEDAVWLYKEFQMRHKHQLGVEWLTAKNVLDVYGINCFGAILSQTAASVDAYKLTHKLIELSVKKGMKVFDQTSADNFEFKNDNAIIHTSSGHAITCNKVIFCTGYEATDILKERICKLHYTYACISEQNISHPSSINNTLVWDTGSPYSYLRTTNDKRILIGGADSNFNISIFQNTIKKIKTNQLIHRLSEMMPKIKFIEDFSWGGTFGSTKDSLPYIGESPEYKNALFVLGYGGNGIIFSVQAMEIINDLLKGKINSLAHWYRFKR